MAKQTISRGTSANDGTGTPLRAGATIINQNFDEIYTALGDGTTISSSTFVTNDNSVTLTNKIIDSASNTITITESDISDLGSYITLSGSEALTNKDLSDASNTFPTTTLGSTSVSLGDTITDLPGITSLNVDNISVNGNTITATSGTLSLTNLTTPSGNTDAATKLYVDTVAAAGIHYHDPVRVEAVTNLNAAYDNGTSGVGATLTNSGTQEAITIDGITLSLNDRVLVYNQTNAAHNGIYYVSIVGDGASNWELTRATDADSYGASDQDALGEGDAFFVLEGNTGAGELYVMNTSGTITFGTTEITFSQISATPTYTGGDGIDITGTTFSVDYDDSTINVDAGVLQVKDGGITSTQLNSAVNLQVLDSTGSVLKTLYGTGS